MSRPEGDDEIAVAAVFADVLGLDLEIVECYRFILRPGRELIVCDAVGGARR